MFYTLIEKKMAIVAGNVVTVRAVLTLGQRNVKVIVDWFQLNEH